MPISTSDTTLALRISQALQEYFDLKLDQLNWKLPFLQLVKISRFKN